MKQALIMSVVGLGGLLLGGLLGFSVATLTEPTDDAVTAQTIETTEAQTRAGDTEVPDTTANDTVASDIAATDIAVTDTEATDTAGADAAADDEARKERLDENVAAISTAVVAIESYGCGVGAKATGLSVDPTTIVVPAEVNNASWYLTVDGEDFTFPDHVVIDGVHPAVAAPTRTSISALAVSFGELIPNEAATIVWADDTARPAASGTVMTATGSDIEITITSAVPPFAVGGAIVNDVGELAGVIESVDGGTIIGRPLTSVAERIETEPPPSCSPSTSGVVTEPVSALSAQLRPELNALLTFQLEEDHLSNGDYDLAQSMDPTLAKLSWDQMVKGWSVTADSFVVPVRWSITNSGVEWRLGLITHETDNTSKLFCVTRAYDDDIQTITRSSRNSALVFERRPGWVEPNDVLDEVKAAC